MSADRRLEPNQARLEGRLLAALVYCALVLTLLEYWFLPARAARYEWVRRLQGPERELAASLVWAGATIFFFLVVPLLIVRFVHRGPLSTAGFGAKGFLRHLPVYLGLFALMVPVVWFAAERPEFQRTYPFVKSAATDLRTLLVWESAYVLQFFALESFFRGYLLFTAAAVLPKAAVAVSAVPYTMIHFHKPFPECLGALFAGLLLGHLALRYRSFLGGVVLHALVAVSMDLIAVARGS
jgi:uncharacterized protein